MDDYKLLWNGTDVTSRVGDLRSTECIDGLSVQLTFRAARNPHDKYMGALPLEPGDPIQLVNNGLLVFRGLLTRVGLDGSASASDFGFYLNKSKIILQCNGVAADAAIRQMAAKAGVSLGTLPAMATKIQDVYIDKEPSAILKDILDKVTAETGTRYFSRVEPERGLCVYAYPTAPVKVVHQLAKNLRPFDPTWSLGAVSGEKSIEDLRNQVVVYRDENDQAERLASASDSASIGKYGWLQHMERADEAVSAAQAAQLARTTLSRLNKPVEAYRVDNMLGADGVRAGVMLRFSSDAFGLAGDFVVTQADHSYAQTGHTMSLEVERA